LNKYISLFIFLLCSLGAISQVENEMDKKYIPPEGSLFDTEKTSSGLSEETPKNFIKWNTSTISHGILSFEYERQLISALSITAGVGASIFPDYILYTREQLTEYYLPVPELNGNGLHLAGGLHYNFEQAGSGQFLELKLRRTKHAYYSSEFRDSYDHIANEFMFGYGASGFSSGVLFDFAFGVGYRDLSNKTVEETYNYITYETVRRLRYYQKDQFFIYLTINIGFGL